MPRSLSRRSKGDPNTGSSRDRRYPITRTLNAKNILVQETVRPHAIHNSKNKGVILTRRKISPNSPTPRSSLVVESLSSQAASSPKAPPAAYSEVKLSDFAAAVFDIPPTSVNLKDIARKLATSSDYESTCRRFLSSLESTSSTESDTIEDGFIDVLKLICRQCDLLGLPGASDFNPFAHPAYDQEDSEQSTEDHFVLMGMRRGPLMDTWSWADLLVAIDTQPADSSFGSHTCQQSAVKHPVLSRENGSSIDTKSHQDQSDSPYTLPSCASRLRRYAELVMTAKGNRRHVIGLLTTGSNVSFWYFDRGGGFYSAPVNLLTDAVEIISAVMQLALSGPVSLGLEPFIQSSSSWEAFGSIEGSCVVVDGIRFLLHKTLHVARELEGRGTVVFAAQKIAESARLDDRSTTIPDDVIIKFSWQDASAPFEDLLFRRAQECAVEGIAKLYCSSRPARLSTGPRRALGLIAGVDYHDRELRVQVMGPLCIPLYRVKGLDVFKTAFRSLVQAHRSLYERAGILHHDISINNLMVEEGNEAKGVLIDLDLAVVVRGGDSLHPQRPTLAGTLPFLSVDFLDQLPPRRHMYRHDLESFLLVLGWILIRFDENGTEIQQDELSEWYTGTRHQMKYSKRGFFSRPIGSPVSRYPSLQQSWLWDLGQIFHDGYSMRDRKAGTGAFDHETLGGHVTYGSFLDILH
ncbi:uncharacterized protein EI90DRAFT_3012761 [Cantharellus anzutake]|uniref:uncharacterized protein n=1 Tax=Cantharellus anzutake TaxID=1750568 RepID=UPI0019050746|nr:uncharacterized protein EI90DRAFT_3012761 [Cantharellus anzutake]KAF8339831.1 hypothetical protein EI90DRAFT_3012761 [Cantharellus anzutake]